MGGEGQHEDTSLKFPKQNTSDKWKILKASKRKKKKKQVTHVIRNHSGS